MPYGYLKTIFLKYVNLVTNIDNSFDFDRILQILQKIAHLVFYLFSVEMIFSKKIPFSLLSNLNNLSKLIPSELKIGREIKLYFKNKVKDFHLNFCSG